MELRKARLKKDITQQELADKVGVTRKSINMYENKHRIPDLEIASKIADALEVTLEELIGR